MTMNTKLIWLDDDIGAMNKWQSTFNEYGFDIIKCSSVARALKYIKEKNLINLLLDVDFPNSHKEGIDFLEQLQHIYPDVAVVVLTGYPDYEDTVISIRDFKALDYLVKPIPFEKNAQKEFFCRLRSAFSKYRDTNTKTEKLMKNVRIFIVHGHDDNAKLELKNYLQNVLGFEKPIILHEKASMGKTIIEKLEHYSKGVNLVFVLLTPDDKMAAPSSTDKEKRRARQNVIFELGYFLGRLGRESSRVILLHKGEIELPSDISGIIYIDIENGISAAREQIRVELEQLLE